MVVAVVVGTDTPPQAQPEAKMAAPMGAARSGRDAAWLAKLGAPAPLPVVPLVRRRVGLVVAHMPIVRMRRAAVI